MWYDRVMTQPESMSSSIMSLAAFHARILVLLAISTKQILKQLEASREK